jgi:ribosome biogenesis GTPase
MNPDNPAEGLVVGAYSRRMQVRLPDNSEVPAKIKGKKMRPVCGDHVLVSPMAGESEWLISKICERRNELARPDSRGKREVLAANLDLMIVMAASAPAPDWFIVDRYIAAAENMQIGAAVAFNKMDLNGAAQHDNDLAAYEDCLYSVVRCSATTGAGIAELAHLMAAGTSIIVGQSGVGKSSVINRLVADVNLKTSEISGSTGEGRHTTVASVLLDLPDGGSVIDSPGVRDYAPAIATTDEAIRGFREINETGGDCRFANCRHLREPDCAVKKAVEQGRIAERRYRSYRRLVSMARDRADRN